MCLCVKETRKKKFINYKLKVKKRKEKKGKNIFVFWVVLFPSLSDTQNYIVVIKKLIQFINSKTYSLSQSDC